MSMKHKKLSVLLAVSMIAALCSFAPAAHAAYSVQFTVHAPQGSVNTTYTFDLHPSATNISATVSSGNVQVSFDATTGKCTLTLSNGALTEPLSFTRYVENAMYYNTLTQTYSGNTLISTEYSWDNHDNHPTLYYNVDGYAGTLEKYRVTVAASTREYVGAYLKIYTVFTGHYQGVATKSYSAYKYNVSLTYDLPDGALPLPEPIPQYETINQKTITVSTGETVYFPIQAINLPGSTTEAFGNGQLQYTVADLTLVNLDARDAIPNTSVHFSNEHMYVTGLPSGYLQFRYPAAIVGADQSSSIVLTVVAFKANRNCTTTVYLS